MSLKKIIIKNYLSCTSVNKAIDKLNNNLGFKNKKELQNFLQSEIIGFEMDNNKCLKISEDKINLIINKTIENCQKKIELPSITVSCFPSHNKFINDQMSGISGYTPNSHNVLLFIANRLGWQTALKNTVAHELAHAISYSHHQWLTLLDSLIFEGVAEHFRQATVGGKISPWVMSLSQSEAIRYFQKIKKSLNNSNESLYNEIFLGYNKKYPLWAGYAIGYYIVKDYLTAKEQLSWSEIFKLTPRQILKDSKYFKTRQAK